MQLLKWSTLCAAFGLIFLLGISLAAAEETKQDNSAKIKDLQNQQQKIRVDYEQNKKDIQSRLQKVLTDYKEEPGNPTRQDLVKENNKKQDELRVSFQKELRKLQTQERKLRLGRESLERPNLGGKQAAVYSGALTEKQKRLDLQKRQNSRTLALPNQRAAQLNAHHHFAGLSGFAQPMGAFHDMASLITQAASIKSGR